MQKNRHARAFSLFELLLVLSILIILLLIAVPSWRYLIAHNQLQALEQRIQNEIEYTRRMAIETGNEVSLCGSVDFKRCSGAWDSGQIVFVPTSLKVLRVFQKIRSGYHLQWHSSFSRNNKLSFNADGFTDGQQGHFSILKADPENQTTKLLAKIIILDTGQIRVSRLGLSH